MNEPTQDPQGVEPAIDAPEVPVSEQPQDTSAIEAELDNLSPTELAKALGFDTSEEAPTDDETPQPDGQTPAVVAPETPGAQPEPEIDDPEPQTPNEKPVNRRRLSVTGLPDEDRDLTAKAIAMVREGKATTILQAMNSLAGGQQDAFATPADSNAPAGDPAPTPPATPTLLELEARFDAASEELAESIRTFDQDAQIALNKEISLLNRQILRAEQAEAVQKVNVSSYQQDYADAVTEMETKYAELLDDEDSPFADWLDDKVEAAKARRDPALSDPKFILTFAEQIAAQVSKVNPQATVATPVPPRPSKVVGAAVAPAHKSKPQLTGRQAEEFIDKASSEVLAAALWG